MMARASRARTCAPRTVGRAPGRCSQALFVRRALWLLRCGTPRARLFHFPLFSVLSTPVHFFPSLSFLFLLFPFLPCFACFLTHTFPLFGVLFLGGSDGGSGGGQHCQELPGARGPRQDAGRRRRRESLHRSKQKKRRRKKKRKKKTKKIASQACHKNQTRV